MSDYPNLWKRGLIQAGVRQRAGHCCEECRMEFVPGTNLAVSAVNRKGAPIIGTVHHIDGDKQNCSMGNLVYLCQRCHMYVQHRWKPGDYLPRRWANGAPSWIEVRALAYQPSSQLSLF